MQEYVSTVSEVFRIKVNLQELSCVTDTHSPLGSVLVFTRGSSLFSSSVLCYVHQLLEARGLYWGS